MGGRRAKGPESVQYRELGGGKGLWDRKTAGKMSLSFSFKILIF